MPTTDTPRIFRVVLQVTDGKKAAHFYQKLLGIRGRAVGGGRAYFECGPVILALLDPSHGGPKAKPSPDDLYFSVRNLEKVHARAKKLRCLVKGEVHGEPAGEVTLRPWGERSFYAQDPFGNELCFVDARTLFTGR